MSDRQIRRRPLLGSIGAGTVYLAGCLDSDDSIGADDSSEPTGGDDASGSDTDPPADDASGGDSDDQVPEWMTTELEEVTTEETFTLEAFDVPVLLETFAVWCPDCLEQQQESAALHEESDTDVVSVGLNVDPNEEADIVRDHAERHGFDWHFAVAPPDLTRSLVDEFGESIAHPPASPVVLVCPEGSARRLDDGLLSASTLESEVESGC